MYSTARINGWPQCFRSAVLDCSSQKNNREWLMGTPQGARLQKHFPKDALICQTLATSRNSLSRAWTCCALRCLSLIFLRLDDLQPQNEVILILLVLVLEVYNLYILLHNYKFLIKNISIYESLNQFSWTRIYCLQFESNRTRYNLNIPLDQI